MDFEKVISRLEHQVGNKTNISWFVKLNMWTDLRKQIKICSLSKGKVWSDGYALLDKVVVNKDAHLLKILDGLFVSLSSEVESNKEFSLLKFIFYYAILHRNKHLIETLLTVDGVCVNDPLTKDGKTPMYFAIHLKAGLDIMKLLLDHGACVNSNNNSVTPLGLVFASLPSDLDVAELLYSSGADVNTMYHPGSTMRTLVHRACYENNNEGLKWLLNHKADPNVVDECGDTGLHLAASQQHLSIVTTLLQFGASVNTFNNTKQTPLSIAVEKNNSRIVELLLRHCAKCCDTTLSKAFHTNVVNLIGQHNSYDQHRILQILTNYGFVLNLDINDKAFIHAAARNSLCKVVKSFLEAGGSPDSTFVNTPLLYDAIKSKNKELVKTLLDYGPDTSYEDNPDESALTISVSSNLVEITELLFSKGHNRLSQLCVFIAADNLNIDILKVLVKFGVSVNLRDEQFMSPLHYVITSKKHASRSTEDDLKKTEVVKFLLNHGVSIEICPNSIQNRHPIHFAISLHYVQVVKILLEAGTSFNHFEEVGGEPYPSTVLHYSIQYNSLEMVKLLLEKGAEVDALQFDNRTPLEIAVDFHVWEVVRVLLAHGANVSKTAACNKNIVFYAVEENCPPEVVTELVKGGADVDSRGYNLKTALHRACARGQSGLVAVLLDNGADINAVDYMKNTPFTKTKKDLLSIRFNAQGINGYKRGRNISGSSTALYHLQRHAFKMNFVGLPVHSSYKQVLELDYEEDFISSCKKEVEAMKATMIGDSYLTFYDIIKQKQDPAFVTNNNVLLYLDENDQWETFTLFRGILKDCIKKAMLRDKLLDFAQKEFSEVSGLNYLPNEIIRKIMSYLKNEELQIFTGTAKSA